MLQRKEDAVLRDILNSLGIYTLTHFKTEEKYFDQFGYSGTDNHKKEHADFVQKVSGFRDEFERGEVDLSFNVMIFLKDWLINHIKGSDKKYSQFFNEKGLK